MPPSLRSGRSIIVYLRIAVVPKDRLVIIPSLASHDTGGRVQRFEQSVACTIMTVTTANCYDESVCPYLHSRLVEGCIGPRFAAAACGRTQPLPFSRCEASAERSSPPAAGVYAYFWPCTPQQALFFSIHPGFA
jgi:hypothetical protein